jgi:hypothetical protein
MSDSHHRLPSVFLGNLLESTTIEPLSDNFAVSRFLMDRALSDLGGNPINGPSVEGDNLIASMLADEVMYALSRTSAPNSLTWYTDAIERMIAVASVLHPEISSDEEAVAHPSGRFKSALESRVVLFTAMALTSQNNVVLDNMRYALEQYRAFLATGEFLPKVYGANGTAVFSNLQRFNFVLSRTNGDLTRFHRLMTMELSMRDLVKFAARFDIQIGGKELADETVYGSMIFGPKVGNGFLQNLLGNHKPITIDLWFMRTWGRYTGTILRDQLEDGVQIKLANALRRSQRSERMTKLMADFGVLRKPADVLEMDNSELLSYARELKLFWEKIRRNYTTGKLNDQMNSRSAKLAAKKTQDNASASELKSKLGWPSAAESIMRGLGAPVDSPRNASSRAWIRSVCQLALTKLKANGFNMTAANLQATLWYPEKELYGKLTGRPATRFTMSYDDAIIEIAKKEGFTDERIAAALRTVGKDGAGRQRDAERDVESLTGTDGGVHRRIAGRG